MADPTRSEYEPPPGGRGEGKEPTQFEEDAGQSFAAPDAQIAEAAALSEPVDVLAGASAALLDARRAIEEQLQQDMAPAAARAADALAGPANIQGVGIGLADEPGPLGAMPGVPGEPALSVFVAEPMTAQQVRSVAVSSMKAASLSSEEVPLKVLVTGLIDAQPHRFRIRPAPGGVSVAHSKVTAGTIGCLCIGRTPPRNRRLMVLSNNHVLANSNNAVFGDCICQPGPYDGGRCPADQIAILERFVPINFAGGANFVDCATGWAWPDRVRRELVFLRSGAPSFFRIGSAPVAPFLGMLVGKSGRTTQLTAGRVTAIGVTVRVNYGLGRVALFQDQIAIQGLSGNFSAGGDSGSSIWTWNSQRNPVGLLFAGGGGVTFANRITRVLAALDINLVT